jgi:hypothetical protein
MRLPPIGAAGMWTAGFTVISIAAGIVDAPDWIGYILFGVGALFLLRGVYLYGIEASAPTRPLIWGDFLKFRVKDDSEPK